MTTDHPNPSKPRRRWFQFSLRTLFVLVTVLCVWLAVTVERVRRHGERFLDDCLPTAGTLHWLRYLVR